MKEEKHFFKQWWFWAIIVVLITIPIIINCLYMAGLERITPNTAFSASDMILFYGSFLSFIGTVSLGALALWQNKQLSEESNNHQKKLERINDKLLEIDTTKERNMLFEMFFCYMEENQKIYDPEYVLQKICQEHDTEEIFFRLKKAQSNAQKIKRRLMFIDETGTSHVFFGYCEKQSKKALSIVQLTEKSTEQVVKELFEFWKNNAEDFNSKSLEFIYDTNKRLLKEKK